MGVQRSSRLRKNHFGTAELRWPARLVEQETTWQDRRARQAGKARPEIRDARFGMRVKSRTGETHWECSTLNVELSGLGRRTTVRYPKFEVSGTRNPATRIPYLVSRISYPVSRIPSRPSRVKETMVAGTAHFSLPTPRLGAGQATVRHCQNSKMDPSVMNPS